MATKKEKVNFSKFFPSSTSYVVLEGYAKGSDDFDVTLKMGDGSNQFTVFTTDWYKDGDAVLKAMREAIDKALEFQDKAAKMGKAAKPQDIFDSVFPTPKKAAPKKKATKK
jgi:hypothetical protein